MTQTGTRQFAAFIMKFCEYNTTKGACPCGCQDDEPNYSLLPKGWKFLGKGSYRWAFLAPDGVVYKVDRKRQSDAGNDGEARNFTRITAKGRMPAQVYIPAWTLYEFGDDRYVMAMEKVETRFSFTYCDEYGDDCNCDMLALRDVFADMLAQYNGCWTQWLDSVGGACGLYDLHEENIFPQADGRVALIDGGF